MTISAQDQQSQDGILGHLRTDTSTRRLNQIEKIRANGVGDLVSLPQLVVCGDQSAGKSSVLEGLTKIPFPRQEGLCTRFPTEIILRHSETVATSIKASIRPHKSTDQRTGKALSDYQKIMNDMSELPGVIHDVSRLMKIRGYAENDSGHAFARDALRVEISGPVGLHLSVVDLPGLISVSNESQTEEDVEAVHDMVNRYLQNPRSIILAVLQASNDMANQGIIKLAREHDPQGQRTVGIITKPDLINEGSEAKIAQAAKNQDAIKLKLGFFLVKNPSPSELKEGLSMADRAKRELRFFSAPAWARQNLDMSRVGSEKMRYFLQGLLDAHIQRELPSVRDEIKKMLTTVEADLVSIGDARPTVGHIRTFLTIKSMQFYELLQAALNGDYHGADTAFFSNVAGARLRAYIENINMDFAERMRTQGERHKLVERQEAEAPPKPQAPSEPKATSLPEVPSQPKVPSQPGNSSPSSSQLADPSAQLVLTEAEMRTWIKETYRNTRGKELPGTSNPALLAELFREHSLLWRGIAEAHIQKILTIVSQWIDAALGRIMSEDGLQGHISAILREWIEDAETSAHKELEKLMEDEKRGPQTYNHYFTDNVQKSRTDIQEAAMRRHSDQLTTTHSSSKFPTTATVSQSTLNKFISATTSTVIVDMEDQACREAKIELNAYYKVAMKTFVDNVARQVIARHIIAPLPQAFCPQSVTQLSDEKLLEIGTEPADQAERRQTLISSAAGLRESLKELQRPV
ncbi:putative dynamin GTPase [Stachybotrys elegans]|uniref:Dynamin GTPase n=1 Tax=Stachybotrys elegans TaxID=80388 RepID=A0A8K0S883_9HYPO|nr:putative dynamin GTPase [Stachybotrys elegans]